MLTLIAAQLDIAGQAMSQDVPGSKNLGTPDAGFGKLFSGLLSVTMTVAAILLFGYLIWGGIDWLTSGGEKGKVEAARTKITTAVTGIIVLAASTAVMHLLQAFLGICFLNIGGKC